MESYEGFNSDKVISKFEARFGETGSRWLSVVSSLMGMSRYKIKHIEILCDGQELQGYYSIDELMAKGYLADKGMNANKGNPELFYLSHIAAAMPHSPFLFLEALDEDDEKVARVIGFDISTSLPRSLRYYHAADLPLGPKTRQAHLLWAFNFAKIIKSSFSIQIYQRCAQNASRYRNMDHLMALLNTVESNIVLTYDEMDVSLASINH